ncbi:hypothetical protein Hanom_Chr06g00519551 [Helianthus anomalus]
MSAPVCAQEKTGNESVGGSHQLEGEKEDDQPAINGGASLEGDLPMHEDLEHVDNHFVTADVALGASEGGPNRESPIGGSNFNVVGPFPFGSGAGVGRFGLGGLTCEKSPGVVRRSRLGARHKKGQAQEGKFPSPEFDRPRKRSRHEGENNDEGFGFVGFTSLTQKASDNCNQVGDRCLEGIDLNAGADPGSAGPVDPGESGFGGSGDGRSMVSDPCVQSEVDKEVERTMDIGDKLGVQLQNHSVLVKEAILVSGIKLVPQ